MSAEIVNLRRARKAKAREKAAEAAAQNRVAFGRSKAERAAQAAEAAQDARRLEGHRLEEHTGESDRGERDGAEGSRTATAGAGDEPSASADRGPDGPAPTPETSPP